MTSKNSIAEHLHAVIDELISQRKDKHGWDEGAFSKILTLSIDERGEAGERFIENALKEAGVKDVTRAGKIDRTEKHWDIKTADIEIEVKTATLGRNANTFQHENIEKDRKYDAIVFVDIAPNAVYVRWTAKKDIPFKKIHRQAQSTFYKWDFRLKDVQDYEVKTIGDILAGYESVKNG